MNCKSQFFVLPTVVIHTMLTVDFDPATIVLATQAVCNATQYTGLCDVSGSLFLTCGCVISSLHVCLSHSLRVLTADVASCQAIFIQPCLFYEAMTASLVLEP